MLFPVACYTYIHYNCVLLKCVGFSRLSIFVRYVHRMRSSRRKKIFKKKLIRDIIRSLLNVYSLQIVFVVLTELAGDHGFDFTHIVDWSLNCDDAFEIETIDVVDTIDGDLCIGVRHDSFDCVTALTNKIYNTMLKRWDKKKLNIFVKYLYIWILVTLVCFVFIWEKNSFFLLRKKRIFRYY